MMVHSCTNISGAGDLLYQALAAERMRAMQGERACAELRASQAAWEQQLAAKDGIVEEQVRTLSLSSRSHLP